MCTSVKPSSHICKNNCMYPDDKMLKVMYQQGVTVHCRNNENLGRLSCKIVSPLVFAHVRAAYPGMPVSEQNCHPFQFSRYLWMHNGVVGGFMKIRRALLSTLEDAAYDTVSSFHSDSAVSFSIFLNHLPDLDSQQTPQKLLQAIEVDSQDF